jgi:hypothetical protein
MLDDLELPQVQEIATYERRVLKEHKPPGMDGSLLQNLGRRPLRLALWGVATGPQAIEFVQDLDAKFRAEQPFPFVADIIAEVQIDEVLIDDLKWQELAGKPQRYAYVLVLREHSEPNEPEDTSSVDVSVLDDVLDIMNDLTAGLEVIERLSAFIPRLAELGAALQRNQED